MGCESSHETQDYGLHWNLQSPELKRALMQKRFKDAGAIVHAGSVGNARFSQEARRQVIEVDPIDGSNALHWAASVYGAFDVLSWLIEEQRGFDFDINEQNAVHGDTALHIAIRRNIPDAVTIIMRQEMNFSEQLPCNKNGHTALHLAMALNRHELLPLLVSEDGKWDKFNPDSVLDKWGRPAIFAAIETDAMESVQVLVGIFKADHMIASRPNGNCPDEDDTETIPHVTREGNSFSSDTGGGAGSFQPFGGGFGGGGSGNAWFEEEEKIVDPRLKYAQLPTKKSRRATGLSGSSPQSSPQYSPLPDYIPGTPTPSSSSQQQHSPQSQKGAWVSTEDDVPDTSIADQGHSLRSAAATPLGRESSPPGESSLPVQYPHKPNHGTEGLEWQTPLEYAELLGSRRCISHLEKLRKQKYKLRRSTANGNRSYMMKMTSSGVLASSTGVTHLPLPPVPYSRRNNDASSSSSRRGPPGMMMHRAPVMILEEEPASSQAIPSSSVLPRQIERHDIIMSDVSSN